jgi:hypothetical protein
MDLKTYQALASQLEQIADLLLQEAADRRNFALRDQADELRFRSEVLRRLNANDATPREANSDTFLTKSQAKTLWSVAKAAGPWALTAGVGLFHLLAHYLGHH